MCGIAGFFLPSHVAPQMLRLDSMVRALSHRGPNSTGQFVSKDKRYHAAFARLSVIDLKTGEQPIVERDGGLGGVFSCL